MTVRTRGGWCVGFRDRYGLGRELDEKLKGPLNIIGGDVTSEGGLGIFRHQRMQREFYSERIENVQWLKRFEGFSISWSDN